VNISAKSAAPLIIHSHGALSFVAFNLPLFIFFSLNIDGIFICPDISAFLIGQRSEEAFLMPF